MADTQQAVERALSSDATTIRHEVAAGPSMAGHQRVWLRGDVLAGLAAGFLTTE